MTIRLALPVFGDEVAPRFCVASEVLVVDVDDGEVASSHTLSLAGIPWPERLSRLSSGGVNVLLCGGFNRGFEPQAHNLGMQVISGLAGDMDQLIDAYCRGEVEQFRLCPRQAREPRRRRGRGQGRGQEDRR